MKTTISLELFNENLRQQNRIHSSFLDGTFGEGFGDAFLGKPPSSSWVAEIVGFHKKYKYDRKFIKGKRDYLKANSKGSRGIFAWYILESNKYYEIKHQYSWKRTDRYFAKVSMCGELMRVDESEVREWLKDLSG